MIRRPPLPHLNLNVARRLGNINLDSLTQVVLVLLSPSTRTYLHTGEGLRGIVRMFV